jgi:hypothetical protein
MIRFFSFVLTLIFLISSTMVWSSSSVGNQHLKKGIESTEERTEIETSSLATTYFSKIRKPILTPVTNLINFFNFNSVQVDSLFAHIALNRYQLKNTNKPIHITKQVFLI